MRALTVALLFVSLAVGGPVGLASLKILPGVREAGMAGTGVASAFGPQAMAVNPAAGADISGFALTASYAKWLLDTHHQSIFASRNFKALAVGLGVTSLSAGTFEYRLKPTEDPLGTFTPTDFSLYLNLARQMGRLVQLGLTGKYLYSRVYESDAAGVCLDAGIRVKPIEGLTAAASLVDFGKTLTYYREVFWLPTRVRAGLAYTFCPASRFEVSAAADGCYYLYDRKVGATTGVELTWADVLSFRGGYDILATASHASLGLGLKTGIFRFDYALTPMNYDLGFAHRVSVGLGS
jgi:hypothetical protein